MPAIKELVHDAIRPKNVVQNSAFIRPWKINAVRQAIDNDTYLSDERVRVAIERLMPILYEDEFVDH